MPVQGKLLFSKKNGLSAKLNICASNSASSQSPKTLCKKLIKPKLNL